MRARDMGSWMGKARVWVWYNFRSSTGQQVMHQEHKKEA